MSNSWVSLLIFIVLIAMGWVWRWRSQPLSGYALFEGTADAILLFNAERELLYMNKHARNWFNLAEGEKLDPAALPAPILSLLSSNHQASLRIGSRYVQARSQEIESNNAQVVFLRDVTASHHLLEEERRRLYELTLFNDINQILQASPHPSELLQNVIEKLTQLFPYTSAAISLWDPKLKRLKVQSSIGGVWQTGTIQPQDHGYAAHLARERQPLLLTDLSETSELQDRSGMHSYVGVPLSAGEEFIGTLELASQQQDVFSFETLYTLGIIGGQVAVALKNTQLYSRALKRADEMATLNTLLAIINTSLNTDELLEVIVYSVNQAIGCDRSAIFVMDNERGTLSLAKSKGLSEEYIRHSQNLRPRLGGRAQVILERYPLVIQDLGQAPDFAEFLPLARQEGWIAVADLPLRGKEHVLGALTVYYDQPHVFDESEMELLTAFANQVTLALENARLYERTDRALARRVDQLAAIEEVGRELTSTLDITRVFKLVLQRAMGSTGASAGLLALYHPDAAQLELIAERGYPPGLLQPHWDQGWPVEKGIIGRVVRTGETARVNDVVADPDYVVHLQDTQAQLIVPIRKEQHVLGVISMESSRSQGFSPDDGRFTTQLAELAAIAIDNARLFQQVRQGRDNLQAILDSTRDGILVVNADKRIVLANPMVKELSGLSSQEMVGKRASDVIKALGSRATTFLGYNSNKRDQAIDLLESLSDHVTKRTYEIPGPPQRYIEQIASPVVDKDGQVVGRLIVFRDITKERRLAQMRQDLSDMIIHDLRSPLTAVISGIELADDLVDRAADPEIIHHSLGVANESCNRLASLVDSLLDISRLEAGQMPLQRRPVLLAELATEVIQQLRPVAEQQNISLKLETPTRVPPIEADQDLISRVLVNLVDNAVKHSPCEATVVVQVSLEDDVKASDIDHPEKETYRGKHYANQAVRCTVLDTGSGIPAEFRERIFERFAQLGGRRKGTGLGLTFCRLAIQAHGGKIWVEDNPGGKGSAFSFTLPAAHIEVSLPVDSP